MSRNKSRSAWLPAWLAWRLLRFGAGCGAGLADDGGGAGAEEQRCRALGQADVQKAAAQFAQSRRCLHPFGHFGSGLPAFSEVGFTGSLPTIWDSTVQSLVFSMPQIQLHPCGARRCCRPRNWR